MYFYIVTERQRANVADSDSVTYAAVTVKPKRERGNLFCKLFCVVRYQKHRTCEICYVD